MSKILLSNVIENKDDYKWSELNCFYKVFAIALGASDKSFFDYFVMHVSAYILYGIRGKGHLSFDSGDCVLEYYRRELQHIFGNELNTEEFGRYRRFVKKLNDSLNEDKVVIVPCDLFYLPYCKSYKELHKRHYMIVKGIDTENGIVYILDNMHVNLGASTIYKDFMLDTRVLYDMAVAFRNNFENISNKGFFWSVGGKKNKNFKKANYEYFVKLGEIIFNDNYSMELDVACMLEHLEYDIDMLKIMTYSNLRNVFWTSFARCTGQENSEHLKDIMSEWKNIKLELAMTYEKELVSDNHLKERIIKNMDNEKSFISNIKENVNGSKELPISDEIGRKYTVINKNNAIVTEAGNSIDIILSENDTYDIWNNCNNGVIVLLNDVANEVSARVKVDTEFGSSSHCGIFIELVDGSRILFGSLGRLNMAIHDVNAGDKYEAHIYQEVVDNEMHISIRFDKDKCMFYSKDNIIYTMNLRCEVLKVGYFVKTWENCYCKASFKI